MLDVSSWGWVPGWLGLQGDPGGENCSLLVSRPHLCEDSSVLHAGFLDPGGLIKNKDGVCYAGHPMPGCAVVLGYGVSSKAGGICLLLSHVSQTGLV